MVEKSTKYCIFFFIFKVYLELTSDKKTKFIPRIFVDVSDILYIVKITQNKTRFSFVMWNHFKRYTKSYYTRRQKKFLYQYSTAGNDIFIEEMLITLWKNE